MQTPSSHRTLSKLPPLTYSYDPSHQPHDPTCPPGPVGPPKPGVSLFDAEIVFDSPVTHPGEWMNASIILYVGQRVHSEVCHCSVGEWEAIGKAESVYMAGAQYFFWNVPKTLTQAPGDDSLMPTDEFRYLLPGTYKLPVSFKIPPWARSSFKYKNDAMSWKIEHYYKLGFILRAEQHRDFKRSWKLPIHRHEPIPPLAPVSRTATRYGVAQLEVEIQKQIYSPAESVMISKLRVDPQYSGSGPRLTNIEIWIRPIAKYLHDELNIKYDSFKKMCPHRVLFDDKNGTTEPKAFSAIELSLPTISPDTKHKGRSYPLPYCSWSGYFASLEYELLAVATIDKKLVFARVPFVVVAPCCIEAQFKFKTKDEAEPKPLHPVHQFTVGSTESPVTRGNPQKIQSWKELVDEGKLSFDLLKKDDGGLFGFASEPKDSNDSTTNAKSSSSSSSSASAAPVRADKYAIRVVSPKPPEEPDTLLLGEAGKDLFDSQKKS